ncbi:uncharacterized protein LOC143020718 [Oratosquilla oratoria]|uniref:uncharacterized protein LOC143020718 n=1 Tax=Oratosquilla oratoria TaxID=337810 RepID=UPI003F767E93
MIQRCATLARVWVLVETVGVCGGGPYWPAKSQVLASHRSPHTFPPPVSPHPVSRLSRPHFLHPQHIGQPALPRTLTATARPVTAALARTCSLFQPPLFIFSLPLVPPTSHTHHFHLSQRRVWGVLSTLNQLSSLTLSVTVILPP